jgi:hypothetical protein
VAKRRLAISTGPVTGSIWASSNFWVPPYRSYPHPPTQLEQLASRLGISDEDLRASLREQIQRRLRERGAAWEALDNRLDKRADSAVAQSGDAGRGTPVEHQHGI